MLAIVVAVEFVLVVFVLAIVLSVAGVSISCCVVGCLCELYVCRMVLVSVVVDMVLLTWLICDLIVWCRLVLSSLSLVFSVAFDSDGCVSAFVRILSDRLVVSIDIIGNVAMWSESDRVMIDNTVGLYTWLMCSCNCV